MHENEKKIFTLWERCLAELKDAGDISEDQFGTWLSPLQIEAHQEVLFLFAPNQFVLDYVKEHFYAKLEKEVQNIFGETWKLQLEVGSRNSFDKIFADDNKSAERSAAKNASGKAKAEQLGFARYGHLNAAFTFTNFVEGKSNQLARAAAMQVAANPGKAYNPLFLYGGVGLGKTHLMHAIGNFILKNKPEARILYVHSERFVSDMVKALQRNVIDDFKRFYRSLDALLIDDVQFFAGKERSQEEFFHTFNALFEDQQQIILTCDRYPKEVEGLEERLKSRFGWGLTVAIEPPELETRVAILLSKAEKSQVTLSSEVAFFIAKHIHSNVRELEGALKRVVANSHFTGQPITLEFAKDALKDLLALRARMVTIENIQKTVAEYFKIKTIDLISARRTRSFTRPRQIAMSLAKELTNHSLPEVGKAFGGRDHATVIHAHRKVKELIAANFDFADDYKNLLRVLSA